MVTEDRSRGQIILIGAIALAFIILGVVVVFNGVLYTETLTSADTGQSASTAETTELEIEQGIGCIVDSSSGPLISNESDLEDEIDAFAESYRATTANSRPAAVDIEVNSSVINLGTDVTVTITYDSDDLSYEQTRTIEASDCPTDP